MYKIFGTCLVFKVSPIFIVIVQLSQMTLGRGCSREPLFNFGGSISQFPLERTMWLTRIDCVSKKLLQKQPLDGFRDKSYSRKFS